MQRKKKQSSASTSSDTSPSPAATKDDVVPSAVDSPSNSTQPFKKAHSGTKTSKIVDNNADDPDSDTESVSSVSSATTANHVLQSRLSHVVRPSLLSSETSGNSYRGFINLAVIILVASNFQKVLENFQKYGLLVSFVEPLKDIITPNGVYRWPALTLFLSFNLWILLCLLIEWYCGQVAAQIIRKKLASPNSSSGQKQTTVNPMASIDRNTFILHTILLGLLLIVPSWVIIKTQPHPAAGVFCQMNALVLFMKLLSYVAVNREQRAKLLETHVERLRNLPRVKNWVRYPMNLTISNIYYFIAAPTLCYELNFPRSDRIRKGWLLRRIFEFIIITVLIIVCIEQYVAPLLRNSITFMTRLEPVGIAERLLKLSVPNLLIWLLGFYAFFQVFLNITGELLRFGDRLFYADWWNSTTISFFWRTWNLPVHRWVVRHLYSPVLARAGNKTVAAVVVFLVSALFHEMLISVPFRFIKVYSFLSMMSQIPLDWISQKFMKGKQIGNVFFWLTIMLGQPLGVLLYYFDYLAMQAQQKA